MEIGGIKLGGKIGKPKDDNNHVLDNKGENFQDKPLKIFGILKKDD